MTSESWNWLDYGNASVPSFLFDAPDAATHVLDFLSNPLYNGFGGNYTSAPAGELGHVLNWTEYCLSGALYLGDGPFIGCLLYGNVSRNVHDGSLPATLADNGYSSSNPHIASLIRSSITTCLPTYCASVPACRVQYACDVGNLLTGGYELSAQGVANCWQTLCSQNAQTVNADIAGIGLLMSYLIQVIIGVLGLCALATLAYPTYKETNKLSLSGDLKPVQGVRYGPRAHYCIISSVIAEFHRAQCYFVIALQIAALLSIYVNTTAVSSTDLDFLFLISLDGLVPVVTTFYTVMTFGNKSWYMIILSIIAIGLAAATGASLMRGGRSHFSSNTIQGQLWPSVCWDTGPDAFCAGFPSNVSSFHDVTKQFVTIVILMIIVSASLLVWKVFTETRFSTKTKSTTVWNSLIAWIAMRSTTLGNHFAIYTRVLLHTLAIVIILGCVGTEFYYFSEIFSTPYVDFTSWSFGQIVGITTWAGVIVELLYLECLGLPTGLEWRFPDWLQVTAKSQPTVLAISNSSPIDSHHEGMVHTTEYGSFKSTMTNTPATSTYPIHSQSFPVDIQQPMPKDNPRRRATAPDA